MFHKNLNINGEDYPIAVNISGHGAPTTSTEGVVGMFYMDEDDGSVYQCTAVSGNVYTWKLFADSSTGGGTGISSALKSAFIAYFTNMQTLLTQLAYVTEDNIGTDLIINSQAVINALNATGGDDSGEGGNTGGDEPEVPEVMSYVIARTLTNCTSSSAITSITEGSSHTETITADEGYTLDGVTVKVTMGGVDISSMYSNGVLTIESVTGNIIISVSAAKLKEYELYYEFTGEQCGLHTILTDAPYLSFDGDIVADRGDNSRLSHADKTGAAFKIEAGYLYKAEFAGIVSNIGVQLCNQATVDVWNGLSGGTPSKRDSGWQTNGYEFTQITLDGDPTVTAMLTFRKANNSYLAKSDLTYCRIYRKEA